MTGDEPFATALAGGLIASPEAAIVLAEWADPGGADPPRYIAPLHVHHEDDEAWYVLDGALVVRSGDRDIEVPAGGAAIVPRGVAHTFWNPEPGQTRYVLVMTPRIRALIHALHVLDERTPEAVAAVFRAHRSEYLGWP